MLDLAASLLEFAHSLFGPGLCPGDWVWATGTAGALLALLPVLASVTITLIRKVTGNTYNVVTLSVFGVIGAVFALILPAVLANGISATFRGVYANDPTIALAGSATLEQEYCGWVGPQVDYLGKGGNVYDVLFHPFEPVPIVLLRVAFLVLLPLMCLLFVILQARAATRRGPRWVSRLVWIPFAVMIVASLPVGANTASYLWAGFLPVSVLGLIPVYVIGPPAWSTIERSYQKPEPGPVGPAGAPPPPYQPPHSVPAYQPPPKPVHGATMFRVPKPAVQPPPQQQTAAPVPPPVNNPVPPLSQPVKPPPYVPPAPNPTLVDPGAADGGRLAADPGPLPFTPRSATPPPPPIKPMGSRFRKVRALGQGGFGTVWLAVDTQLDRTVAVKMAHAPDAETEERMLREARALAAVHHPNCVRVYDIVSEPEGLGLVMEYIEGQPLADRVTSGGPLDDVATARLWITMAGALSAAHAKGVLHRDVKPSNVIIDPDGNAHLIDFGIARSQGDSTLTATGMMVGTPDFLASETAAGANATPASDAWQLAATVSYALTGHPPRGTRENAMAALMAAAKGEPLSQLPQRSAHRRLLLASLDSDPARRPTLRAVARELSDWLAREGHTETGPVTQIVRREDIEDEEQTRRVR